MTNLDKVLDKIRRNPGLDDDELSVLTNVKPRQQVNQICHVLLSRGLIRRVDGPRDKIINIAKD